LGFLLVQLVAAASLSLGAVSRLLSLLLHVLLQGLRPVLLLLEARLPLAFQAGLVSLGLGGGVLSVVGGPWGG